MAMNAGRQKGQITLILGIGVDGRLMSGPSVPIAR